MTFALSRHIRALAAALAAVFACLVFTSEGRAQTPFKVRTTVLAPGVEYIVLRDSRGPNRIRAVRIDPAQAGDIRPLLASGRLPGFERTSAMARRTGAMVAINGDYALGSGRPVHTFASDGFLAQTPLMWGRNFAIDRAETTVHIANPKVRAWAFDPDTGASTNIKRVNAGPPVAGEVARFTPQGGSDERPPDDHCLARLMPAEPPRLSSDGAAVVADHAVEKVRCGGRRMLPNGGSILASPQDSIYAPRLAVLESGRAMQLGWSLGWPGVMDTIGGNPTLIEGGQIATGNVTGEGPFFKRHPRTGVGSTPDGKVLFVIVDGRQPGYSVGMNLKRFAEVFAYLGADQALNLDGGGSTTLAIHGRVVNRPSDGSERPVSSSLVLYPAQAVPQPDQPAKATSTEAWGRAVADPASTGGLADSLDRRGVGLPSSLERAARTFRDR